MSREKQFEDLRSSIVWLNSEKNVKRIMVTSSLRHEGTTTVAVNLAVALARDKAVRVLLVDAHLTHPGLADSFGIENRSGFTDALRGGINGAEIAQRDPASNVSVITSGGDPEKAAEIFNSNRITCFVECLSNAYDYIIFDAAPVDLDPNMALLACHTDGVLLVVHAGKTPRELVCSVKERLQMRQAAVLGVVLNRKKFYTLNYL